MNFILRKKVHCKQQSILFPNRVGASSWRPLHECLPPSLSPKGGGAVRRTLNQAALMKAYLVAIEREFSEQGASLLSIHDIITNSKKRYSLINSRSDIRAT